MRAVFAEEDNGKIAVSEIDLYDEIGMFGVTAKDFRERLKATNGGDILLRINSPGGDVFDGIAIYNDLLAHPGSVTVHITGVAASAASIIAMAGRKIVMSENAFQMIHNAWGIAIGDRHTHADAAALLGKIDSALDLNGSKVCVQANTTTALNLVDYFRANNMKFEEIKLPKLDDVVKAYNEGKCDTLTADVSQLYALRLNMAKPGDHVILPDVISKEPLAPVVRQRDDDWMMIVKWTLYAMINAEELGITSKNIDEALKSKKPDVMRLVGNEGNYGEQLGLPKDWAVRIIRHVGNYGEIYDRNVGSESKLQIPRGLNQLWSAGGIQYAPPIR